MTSHSMQKERERFANDIETLMDSMGGYHENKDFLLKLFKVADQSKASMDEDL